MRWEERGEKGLCFWVYDREGKYGSGEEAKLGLGKLKYVRRYLGKVVN